MARHRWDAPPVPLPPDATPDAPHLPAPRARPDRPAGTPHSEGRHHFRTPPGRDDATSARERPDRSDSTDRSDPQTTPLDLAAIALAAARSTTGPHRLPGPPTTGPSRIPTARDRSGPVPVAFPGTGATGRRRAVTGRSPGHLLTPSRAAGTLAVVGAIASAGVAAASSGSMLADTGSSGDLADPRTTSLVRDAGHDGR